MPRVHRGPLQRNEPQRGNRVNTSPGATPPPSQRRGGWPLGLGDREGSLEEEMPWPCLPTLLPQGYLAPTTPTRQHPRARERRPDLALIPEEGFTGCTRQGRHSQEGTLGAVKTGVRVGGHTSLPKQFSPLPPSREQGQDSDNKNGARLGTMQSPCNSGTQLVSSLSYRQGPEDQRRGVTCPASNSKTEPVELCP